MLSYQQFQQTKRFQGLDGVRTIAIIAVILHHASNGHAFGVLSRGFLGVDLFFILSGFLITTLLLREKNKNGRISLKQFWFRRFLRLMPAYYGLLASVSIAFLLLKPNSADTKTLIDGLPIYALYLSNWFSPGALNMGPLWSLATEEQFYFVWPVLEAFLTPIVLIIVWVGFFLINQLVNFGVLDQSILNIIGVTPGEHPEIMNTTFTPILLGVALAHILFRPQAYATLARVLKFKASPLIFAVGLIFSIGFPGQDISGAHRLIIHVMMMLWIASILVKPESKVTKILSIKPIVFIGMISYGMYLYHMWCMHIARVVLEKLSLNSSLSLFVLTTVITICVATVSYYGFELKFLNLRDRFRR